MSNYSTAEFRNAFLKTIRQIIRESVRNMSIPPAKPPVPSASTPPTPKAEAKGTTKGKRNVQRHSAGTIDYDNVEACGGDGSVAEDSQPVAFRGRSQTIGKLNSLSLLLLFFCLVFFCLINKKNIVKIGENKKSLRRVDSSETRDGDPGVKSENEDDHTPRNKPSLGRTPNHLSLSTTSTLSTGSSSSQAKLIQVIHIKANGINYSNNNIVSIGVENAAVVHSGCSQTSGLTDLEAPRRNW